MDETALVQALNNQHIVTVQAGCKMAPVGKRMGRLKKRKETEMWKGAEEREVK